MDSSANQTDPRIPSGRLSSPQIYSTDCRPVHSPSNAQSGIFGVESRPAGAIEGHRFNGQGACRYDGPGYQTTIDGVEREPEGNCFFAGEHTWSQAGYLNAGVASGDRAARQVIQSLSA